MNIKQGLANVWGKGIFLFFEKVERNKIVAFYLKNPNQVPPNFRRHPNNEAIYVITFVPPLETYVIK